MFMHLCHVSDVCCVPGCWVDPGGQSFSLGSSTWAAEILQRSRHPSRCRIAQGVLLLPCVLALAGFHAWLTCTGRRASAVIFLSCLSCPKLCQTVPFCKNDTDIEVLLKCMPDMEICQVNLSITPCVVRMHIELLSMS